jgi:hypothetical protein
MYSLTVQIPGGYALLLCLTRPRLFAMLERGFDMSEQELQEVIERLRKQVDVLVRMHCKECLIRSHHALPEGYSPLVEELEQLAEGS